MNLSDAAKAIAVLFVGLAGAMHISRAIRRRNGDRAKTGNREMLAMLSARQREIYHEAEAAVNRGDAREGAKLFEGLGFHRKAVDALLSAGHKIEACQILEQTGFSDRAGFIMGAQGAWQEAREYFVKADMPFEEARCSEELGEFRRAAEAWEKAGQARQAARCHAESGNIPRAARLWIAAGAHESAAVALDAWIANGESFDTGGFDNSERRSMIDFLARTPDLDAPRLRQSLSVPAAKESSGKRKNKQGAA